MTAGARALRAALHELAASSDPEHRQLVRLETAIPAVAPLRWLDHQRTGTRCYWANRDDTLELAGVGTAVAYESTDFGSVDEAIADIPELRFLLTARFDRDRVPASEWAPFAAVRVALPAVELRRTSSGHILACHAIVGPDDAGVASTAQRLEEVSEAGTPTALQPPLLDAEDRRTAEWTRGIGTALDDIRAGHLDKVVLARRRRYRADDELCPIRLLEELSARHAGTFRFCFEAAPGIAFLGATPERLYRRRGRDIDSEALAGTRPRGADSDGDARLADELQHSPKDLREHVLVAEHIQRELAPLCDMLDGPGQSSVHRLAHVQHLRTPFAGRLRAGVRDAEILAALHPTPAVGGFPTAAALEQIGRLESFDRGLYCGTVGCLGADESECAVAIRSGLLHTPELFVYAGAGIVDGSNADSEWVETDNKMRAFTAAWESEAES